MGKHAFPVSWLAAALLLGVAVAPAQAQRIRIVDKVPKPHSQNARTIQKTYEWLGCLARTKRAEAVAYLAAQNENEAQRAWEGLFPRNETLCLSAIRARIHPVLLRGVLAEMLYEEQAPEALTDEGAAAPPISPPGVSLRWTEATPPDEGAAGYRIADCYARLHPASVRMLLETKPGSKDELMQMRALHPRLSECAKQGSKPILNLPLMRASLAEALYQQRLSSAPAVENR